jgi:hypothetical protein
LNEARREAVRQKGNENLARMSCDRGEEMLDVVSEWITIDAARPRP